MEVHEAFRLLREGSGSHFDPKFVKAFLACRLRAQAEAEAAPPPPTDIRTWPRKRA